MNTSGPCSPTGCSLELQIVAAIAAFESVSTKLLSELGACSLVIGAPVRQASFAKGEAMRDGG